MISITVMRPRARILAFLLLLVPARPSGFAAAPVPAPGTLDLAKLPPAATTPVDFVRDIQPLFAARCLNCHGPEKQKGELRLDSRVSAMKGGDSGEVILPGRSKESRIIHLVAGLESDLVMPPKGDRLTPHEVGLLRAWIDQGAVWPIEVVHPRVRSEHWSLQPLKAAPVPGDSKGSAAIDAFISARLATNGLAISPPADRTSLIRRVTFDLIGLPPSPKDIDEFLRNKSPRAYEELVERLLASPHYGERWGRHWLDVARYTESQGFEYDRLRDNAWHYRDYVIKSFNDDKPYDRFMKEQLAGDVLEPVTSDGIVGSSLLVCGPWDQAGNAQANATQKAITREEEMEDMLSVVGQTFLGLTINCARCHSHKFDPIPQEEYYRIKSVFDGVKHGERLIATPAEEKAHEERIATLKRQIADAQQDVARLDALGLRLAMEKRRAGDDRVRTEPQVRESGPAAFARWTFDGATEPVMPGELIGGATIAGGRLQLSKEGAFYRTSPLPRDIREKTLEAWVLLASLEQSGGAPISIESDGGQQFDAIVFGERQPKKWTAGSEGFVRTQDLDAPPETTTPDAFVHVAVVYRADNSVSVFRNGQPYGASYTPASPLQTFPAGKAHVLLGMRHTGGGHPWLTGEIKQAALYDRALSPEEVAASFHSGGSAIPAAEILACLSAEQRTARAAASARAKSCTDALEHMKPLPVSYAGTRIQPPPTHRLKRGDVKSPEEIVSPGALSAIVDLDPDFGLAADSPEAQRRLKFADWVADPRNPLPARVMANRIWHYHFGQGLVSTPSDFGVSGARPSNPELLDWLALQFIQNGWSIKTLHRLIVNSAAYRQASRYNPRAAAVDADDQLLWRFPPRRLEAEALRDAMLAASGQLNLQLGGPSFRPFTVVSFNSDFYEPKDSVGPEFNRRTVYRMNVNSGQDPLLDAFDCPEPSVKTPRRGVTTTPLQALALMNNSFVQRQASELADRAFNEARHKLPAAIQAAYRLALGRIPTREESARAVAAAKERGLASVCWVLLNSTEFAYVR